MKIMYNYEQSIQKQILSFSCFDPIGNQGGVSKVIREHMQLFQDAGYCYALLFPIAKIKTRLWGNLINSEFRSLIATGDVCDRISREGALTPLKRKKQSSETEKCGIVEIHLHHLMRMNLNEVAAIVGMCDVPVKFFIHDFYSLCPSINFIDSEGKYCGDSPMSEEKCCHCALYKNASRHRERIGKFFQSLEDRLTVIAPSEYALSVWLRSFKEIKCHTRVVPLQKSEGSYAGNHGVRAADEPLRIAYVGSCVALKGYVQWKTAVAACLKEKRNYRFYVFGDAKERADGVTNVSVNVSKVPTDMVDKLRKYEIDVAIINSIWGETYSYTLHECLAANAYIVTNKLSGNVAANVHDRGNGIVLERPDDLADFLLCEEALRSRVLRFREKCSPPDRMVPNADIVNLVSSTAQISKGAIANTWQSRGIFLQKILHCLYTKFMTIGYRIARYMKGVSV